MEQHFSRNNCAIRECTGDGVYVGRCWFTLKDDVCPRHGDVSAVMVKYRETGELTNEPLVLK